MRVLHFLLLIYCYFNFYRFVSMAGSKTASLKICLLRRRLWLSNFWAGIFFRQYYSHKRQRPGPPYEIEASISTGNIVWAKWATNSYPCGLFPGIKSFSEGLKRQLAQNEAVLFDKGYSGYQAINELDCDIQMGRTLLTLHETASEGSNILMFCLFLLGINLAYIRIVFMRSITIRIECWNWRTLCSELIKLFDAFKLKIILHD